MGGIVEPDFRGPINRTMISLTCAIFCYTLQAWQTGVYKESGELKPDAVGGQQEPKPTLYSPGR